MNINTMIETLKQKHELDKASLVYLIKNISEEEKTVLF